MRLSGSLLVVLLYGSCSLSFAQYRYDFVVVPTSSDLNVNVTLQAFTDGTLIGNYDPTTNPGGTRTKPGLHPFGFAGNHPVPVQVNPLVQGNVQSQPVGTFSMVFHPAANQIILLGLASDLLPSRTVSLPANATLVFDTFTTRSPTSTYPGGSYPVPLGDIAVRSLTIMQTDEPAVGTLTPLGGNRYAFAVAPMVRLYVYADLQGTVLETTSNPSPLMLTGEVEILGDTARVLSVNAIDWSDVDTPREPIPQFAMDLPTVLPPGGVAHLLFNLTLNEVRSGVRGTFTISADGVISRRTVSGTVVLGDYSPSPAGLNVPIEVRPAGESTPLEVHVVALDDGGGYQFQTALWGTFDLSAKGTHWLRQTVRGISLEKPTQVAFTLVNGDVDGDNEVTLFDFGHVVAAFGSMPDESRWNPDADLDGDGEVTLFDFGILVRNFGATGDE